MKMKKMIIICLIAVMTINIVPLSIFANEPKDLTVGDAAGEVFYDDFSGDSLDSSKWLIANKAWGGGSIGNGGVVPENVSVSDGTLKLEAHGDNYTGDVPGIKRPDGTRTGAAIATRDYFGSGSYEVVAKVAPELGVCSAIWTFEYEEYYPGDPKYDELGGKGSYYVVNHEIDIEMPGRASSGADASYEYALCNTWTGEKGGEHKTTYTKLDKAQNDGKFHTYRFDWHTGDDNQTARVEFYFDGKLMTVNEEHIPTNAGRLWIGAWFPSGWAGKTADFDTTIFEVDSVKITPFHEAGDTPQAETYGKDGWAPNSFPEDNPTLEPENPVEDNEPLKFKLNLKSDKENVKKGETFTATVEISEIEKHSADGLLAIVGKLGYDENLVEMDLESLKGLNTWMLNKEYYNAENSVFATDSSSFVSTVGDVLSVDFKVKEDIEAEDIVITVSEIEGGTAKEENGLVAGEGGELTLKVVKDEPVPDDPEIPDEITSEVYDIQETYIKELNQNTTVKTFIENVTTENELVFTDKDGNELGENDIIKTGTKLKVGKTLEYVLVVRGDLDGNGIVNAQDLAMIKLHFLALRTLDGEFLEAARLDTDGKITANDIAIVKLIIIGIIH